MKKVYIIMEVVKELMPEQKHKEIVDVNIIAVCRTKKEAEIISSCHNPFTTKIKEFYMEG